jgi:hypothetical protein
LILLVVSVGAGVSTGCWLRASCCLQLL